MVAGLPLIKVFYLLVRQLSKPISSWLKERAKTHNIVKKNFLVPLGRTYHICEQKIRLKLLGYSPSSILPVSDNQAIETGAEITGEFFIFSIALSFVTYEYIRSRAATSKKESELEETISQISERLMVAEKTICLLSYCLQSMRESQNAEKHHPK
ncbi:Optic atrophy 3 protein [Thelohanellus kitauei]|uniref:Optic atrophy 3 protein n=1 Tax=Thelohanellus kitauei TaxID=669202 RepID=A0A0C2JGK2_THEKT|nr:Optic atrophy 3 protein [Thelohanellus kitauei]